MEQAIVTAVTHDMSEAKVTVTGVPDQPGIGGPAVPGPGRPAVNVDMIVQNTSLHGTTDISFTVPKLRPGRQHRGVPGAGARARGQRGAQPTTTSPGCRSSVRA